MDSQPKIDPEFRDLIPPMATDERRQLEANIASEGCRDPLVVWKATGILVDGHNRFEICTRLGKPFSTVGRDFADRGEALAWLIRNQFGRRNLSAFHRSQLALKLEPLIAAKAKANVVAGASAKASQKSVKPTDRVDSQKELAKAAGVSHDTIAKVKTITAKAAPEVIKKLERGEVTINQAYVAVKSEERTQKKMADLEAKAAAAVPQVNGPTWEIREGDCVASLKKIDAESVRLIFADPPYNIGIDYGEGVDDSKASVDYMGFVEDWLTQCHRVLAADGSAWVMIGHEYAAEYAVLLKRLGFTIRDWIVWYESFGVNCSGKFNRSGRHIFHAVKDDKRFVFNSEAPQARRASARQTVYGDTRASADGKIHDDVWTDIPRVVGTSAERMPHFPTQLPVALLDRIVAIASDEGDTVLDPFNGSGTTGAAALGLGRNYIGLEIQGNFAALARKRLQGCVRTDMKGVA